VSGDSLPACAVVTGAGRGIGRAVALALGRRGLSVALLARTRSELEEVRRAFEAGSDPRAKAAVIPCDVADAGAVVAAAREVLETFGAPRVVINSAGIVRRARTEDTTDLDWDAVIGVNLSGTFRVSRAFLPSMLAQGRGRIVNVASISATLGTAGQGAYNAAKWGVVGFTKSLAEELRGTGLQAMAVLPGAVDTEMLKGSGFAPQMSADAVADTLVFAALDAPDAMNGSAVEIFGA
jgi:NAD(P)-dependent dehydrogenase (short-subunit alcohol dehydrogenase family)